MSDRAGGIPGLRRVWQLAETLPVVGEFVALPRRAGEAAVDGIRGTIDVVLEEVMGALARADLTAVITESLDLNAVLETIDLEALLARLDLDAVLERVDLNQLIDRLDLNPTVAKLDVSPVVAKLDLVGVAEEVVNGIDMNSIVRGATTSVSGEVLEDVRTNSERADDRVEQFVGRILRRQTSAE